MPGWSAYYEDLEFCFRVNKGGSGRFYRNADSMVIHYHQSALPDRSLRSVGKTATKPRLSTQEPTRASGRERASRPQIYVVGFDF
jgi:hypothetical protein